jgi:predicted AlkP superfamily phosphohydrolase/phosphomutase
MTSRKMRILIIGLDGAPFHAVRNWRSERKYPFFTSLIEEGAFGSLQSTTPPLSMLAWPVFYTGKNPGKIGVYVLKVTENRRFEEEKLPTSHDVASPPFWEILGNEGKTVGVVNIPVTYPPRPVNGFLISDFLTPPGSENFTHPPELKDEIPGYVIDFDIIRRWGRLPEGDVEKSNLLEEQYAMTSKRLESCVHLIEKYRPEFFIVNFKGLDNVQHLFWDRPDVVDDFFGYLDGVSRSLVEASDPDYLIVMSDHGFHAKSRRYFHLNSFLEQKGFLRRKKDTKGRFSILLYGASAGLVKRFRFLRRLAPERSKRWVGKELMKHRIDWENTVAYADWHRGIYLNEDILRDESERRTLRNRIVDEMKQIRDPESGEPVFLEVLTREEAFSGQFSRNLPDIIWLAHPDFRLNANLSKELISPRLDAPHITGEHMGDREGILIVRGPEVNPGAEIQGARLIDMAPTVLFLMGSKVPEDLDGRVLKGVFRPGSPTAEREVELGPPVGDTRGRFDLSEDQEEQVKERLKGLGYM